MNTTISTTIPTDIYKDIKKRHFKLNDLLITGYFVRIDNKNIQARLLEAEEKISKMGQKLQDFSKKNWELTEKLAVLEKKDQGDI